MPKGPTEMKLVHRAQFEISIDGVPRSYRDREDLALLGAQFADLNLRWICPSEAHAIKRPECAITVGGLQKARPGSIATQCLDALKLEQRSRYSPTTLKPAGVSNGVGHGR
jgi:hypothetical protein